jgi:hypothetical protein
MDSRIHELSSIVLNFLEVFIHQVLFAKHIYPEAIFERRREYGVPVWMSRHPLLNAQILELLQSLEPLFLANECESVAVLLKGPDQTVHEKYIVDINFTSSYHAATYADLEMMFAAVITRILTLESIGTEMPPGSSFSIVSKIHSSLNPTNSENPVFAFMSSSGKNHALRRGNLSSRVTEQLWVRIDTTDGDFRHGNENEHANLANDASRRVSARNILKSIRAGNLGIDIILAASSPT